MLSKMSLGSFLSWIHKLSMSWRRNESSEPFPLKMWEASKLTERTLWVDAVVAVQFVCVVPGLGRWWIRRTLASWTGCWRRWWGECRSRRATIAVHLLRMAEEKGNFFTAFTDCICWLHPCSARCDAKVWRDVTSIGMSPCMVRCPHTRNGSVRGGVTWVVALPFRNFSPI